MKNLNLTSLLCAVFGALVFVTIVNCGGSSTTEATASSTPTETEEAAPAVQEAACIWDNVAVRDTPSDKGKYLTAISIGEMITFVPEEKDTADKFVKIRLNDGTEGWAKKDFVILDATSHVFINDADVYSRPDALTKGDKKFSKYDIIAVISTKDDFAEVKGKRSEGKWIETAWVKKSNLSPQKLDIASAKFIKKALGAAEDEAKAKGLEDILNNADLSGSAFLTDLPQMINELRGITEEEYYEEGGDGTEEETQEEDGGDGGK